MPGDITICFSCGQINELDKDMNLVQLTPQKLTILMINQPEDMALVMKTVAAIKSRISQN